MTLGYTDEEVIDAIIYIEGLSDEMTKEEMVKAAIEQNVLQQQKKIEDYIQILNNNNSPEIKKLPAKVNNLVGSLELVSSINNLAENRTQIFEKSEIEIISSSKNIAENDDDGRENPEEKSIIMNKKQNSIKYINEDPEDLKTFTCPICYGSFPNESAVSLLNCNHSFCKECSVNYIQEQINANQILNILCPSDGCKEKFEDTHVAKILDIDQNLRYIRLKKCAILNQNPNLKWCVRPGCDKYIIGKPGQLLVKCECGMKICFKCGNQYHGRKSCEAAIDDLFKKYVKSKNVKTCPQCKSRIEKIEGCNHISCK